MVVLLLYIWVSSGMSVGVGCGANHVRSFRKRMTDNCYTQVSELLAALVLKRVEHMGGAGQPLPCSLVMPRFPRCESVNTIPVQLTEQLHFVLRTLHQDRADRVKIVVVAAAQRAGPGLRDLETEGKGVGLDSKGRLFLGPFLLQSSDLRLGVLSFTTEKMARVSPPPGA